jgi:hypothetical protein
MKRDMKSCKKRYIFFDVNKCSCYNVTRVTRRFGKKLPKFLEKVAKTVAKLKMPKYLHQNICIKLF